MHLQPPVVTPVCDCFESWVILRSSLLPPSQKKAALAKLGKYEDAFKVKDSADNLEKWEIARNASIASDSFRRHAL